MERVKLPRDVVDAIDRSKHMGMASIMAHVARFGDGGYEKTNDELHLIYRYYKENPYLIAAALVNGYEVELSPEERVKMYFDHWKDTRDGDFAKGVVRETLDLLNKKIIGVNV